MKIYIYNICILIMFFSMPAMGSQENINKHFENFIKEIRCVVCQNQSLADSHAPLAKDLREKIYTLMVNKKTDEEIKNYLVSRYGEFILLKPRFNTLTLILWLFPFLALIIAILLIYMSKDKLSNN